MKILISVLIYLVAFGFAACKSSDKPGTISDAIGGLPQPTIPTTTVAAMPVGHAWCQSGGGFSPCAPHFEMPIPCEIGKVMESDCRQWTCKESCD